MTYSILANYVASISDLKKHPMMTVDAAHGEVVAILNHNEPVFYCIPAKMYEAIYDLLDDAELTKIITERSNEAEISVSMDDL